MKSHFHEVDQDDASMLDMVVSIWPSSLAQDKVLLPWFGSQKQILPFCEGGGRGDIRDTSAVAAHRAEAGHGCCMLPHMPRQSGVRLSCLCTASCGCRTSWQPSWEVSLMGRPPRRLSNHAFGFCTCFSFCLEKSSSSSHLGGHSVCLESLKPLLPHKAFPHIPCPDAPMGERGCLEGAGCIL